MPRLGYRMSVKSRGKVNTYNQIEGYLIIPMVQPKGDVENIMNEYENNTGIDIEKEVEDAITLMGLKISHAIEYEFNEQFSLTASVGINWILWDYNFNMTSHNNNYYGYPYYSYNTITETTKLDLSAHLGYTYTMLTLNYNLDYIKPSPEMSQ